MVVFSYNGIDYIYPYGRRLQALKEIRRVLKPGGLFIFSSHNNCIPRDFNGVIPFLKKIFKKNRNTFMNEAAYPWGKTRLYLTTPALQIEELKEAGFELVALIPRKKYLQKITSLGMIGLIDFWVYYVAKSLGAR